MSHRALARSALLRAAPLALAALAAAPGAARAASMLNQSETLAVGQPLTSADGHVVLTLDASGNLAMYAGPYALWTSGSAGVKGDYYLRFSTACSLSVRKGTAGNDLGGVWSASASSSPATCFAKLGNDGTLTINSGAAPTGTGVLWTSQILYKPLAQCTDTYRFRPAGTDNDLVFHVDPAATGAASGGWKVTSGMVWLDFAGGVSMPMQAIYMSFKGATKSTLNYAQGSLQTLPSLPSVGNLAGIQVTQAAPAAPPVDLVATAGGPYTTVFPQLPLKSTRNYVSIQIAYDVLTGGGTNPLMAWGASTSIQNTVQNGVNKMVQILIDPTDPGLFGYAGLIGMGKLTGINNVSFGVSANGNIAYTPKTITHLTPGDFYSVAGEAYLGGSVPVNKVVNFVGTTTLQTGPFSSPSLPLRLGINAGLQLAVPLVGSVLGLTLDIATASATMKLGSNNDYSIVFSGVSDSTAASAFVAKLPVPTVPKEDLEMWGSFGTTNNTIDASSNVNALGSFHLTTTKAGKNMADPPPMADIDTVGTFAASKTGFTLTGTTKTSPLNDFPLSSAGTLSSSYSVDGKTFNLAVSGAMSCSGVGLVNATATITNDGATIAGEFKTSVLDVKLSGTATSAGASLTGSSALDLPINIPTGTYSVPDPADAAACSTHVIADAAACGKKWVTDAGVCGGTHLVQNAAACGGTEQVTDAVQCGTSWKADAVACGTTVGGYAECAWACKDKWALFQACSCNVANSCEAPNTCTVDKSCQAALSCFATASCPVTIKPCTFQAQLTSTYVGKVTGNLNLTLTTNKGLTAAGANLKYCPSGGTCTTLTNARFSLAGGTPTLCASGFLPAGDLCLNLN